MQPFSVTKRLTSLEINPGTDRKRIITADEQLDMWKACALASRADPDSPDSWTAIFSGPTHIAYGECLAAHLAALTIDSGRNVLWVDVSEAMGKKAYSVDDIAQLRHMQIGGAFSLVVVTGLRANSPETKWDRAFDLLRSTSVGSNRILVAAGLSPHEASKKIGLPAQRMIHLSSVNETVIL